MCTSNITEIELEINLYLGRIWDEWGDHAVLQLDQEKEIALPSANQLQSKNKEKIMTHKVHKLGVFYRKTMEKAPKFVLVGAFQKNIYTIEI